LLICTVPMDDVVVLHFTLQYCLISSLNYTYCLYNTLCWIFTVFGTQFFFLRHHCHFVSFKQRELISADNGPDTVQNRYPVDETRLHGHSNPRFVA